jgi:hypothetical protein
VKSGVVLPHSPPEPKKEVKVDVKKDQGVVVISKGPVDLGKPTSEPKINNLST